jgi:2-iminoacetate synthase
MLPQNMATRSDLLPVSPEETSRLLASATPFRRREAFSLLRSLSPRRKLSLPEAARLLATSDPMVWETAAGMARAVREEVFGRRIVLFAPLYLSNECGNNCLYCGFRKDNREAERITLSPEHAVREAKFLERKGFHRLLLVSGEHPGKTDAGYIADVLKAIYRETEMRILHVNAAPMTEKDLRLLKEAGAGVYQVFQETYHPETYATMHPSGPKADYAWRLTCMDRAMRAGFEDVGIGALLGLYDYRFEVLSVIRHAESLRETYGTFPHTISVPRFKPAFGSPLGKAPCPVSDEEFEKIVIVYRLSVPTAGIVVTTREPAALRDRVLHAAGRGDRPDDSRARISSLPLHQLLPAQPDRGHLYGDGGRRPHQGVLSPQRASDIGRVRGLRGGSPSAGGMSRSGPGGKEGDGEFSPCRGVREQAFAGTSG